MSEINVSSRQHNHQSQKVASLIEVSKRTYKPYRRNHLHGLAFLILATVCFATLAQPLPKVVINEHPLKLIGEGEMTWFGIGIYNASLWTISGKYTDLVTELPIALHITYKKNIHSKKLVEATSEEWERLHIFNSESRRHWARQLSQIWPNVKPGDSITTLITENRITKFYSNDNFIGEIEDPHFGPALLMIWLHPDTSEPELREKLIRGLRV